MPTQNPSRAPLARPGFTLIELMIALVLFALVGATLIGLLNGQQRFYTSMSHVTATQNSVREAYGVLPPALRGIWAAGGDIYAMSDTAIEFRAPAGHGVICTISPSRLIITVPPRSLAKNNGLTAWMAPPSSGDSLLVFHYDSTVWRGYRLAAAPVSGAGQLLCPMSTKFTSSMAEESAAVNFTLDRALPSFVIPGTPILFFRRTRLSLFREGDNKWYLGWSDCLVGRTPECSAPASASGPYLPPGTAPGLAFTYRDSTGTVTTDRARVSRIDFTARAESLEPIKSESGRAPGFRRDSLQITIAVRNRS